MFIQNLRLKKAKGKSSLKVTAYELGSIALADGESNTVKRDRQMLLGFMLQRAALLYWVCNSKQLLLCRKKPSTKIVTLTDVP
tara:strand:- start:143 stop:391 length:249 start_codon:yes stop_codon:yes gene_type:complete